MAVRVDSTQGEQWEIVHDEPQHGGLVDPSALDFGTNIDGSLNRDVILVPCPVCGAVSYWPRELLPEEAMRAVDLDMAYRQGLS